MLKMNDKTHSQSGEMNVLIIPLALVSLIALGLAGFGGWAYLQYIDARDNVQSKIDVAVSEARADQQEKDAKIAAERRKEPYQTFVGPSSLGRVQFDYPKTWSVYIAEGGNDGSFLAALHPEEVHPLDSNRPYALKVEILSESYESVINNFQSEVADGELRSQPVTINGFNGVQLTGKFSDDITNAQMVIFKVRDKTLQVSTEAPQYFADFKNIILESLRFNP